MNYLKLGVLAFSAVLGCSTPRDYSLIDGCMPGKASIPGCTAARIELREHSVGGLRGIHDKFAVARGAQAIVLTRTLWFSTDPADVLHFVEKKIGVHASHGSSVPTIELSPADSDYWIVSDGTWVLTSGLSRLTWYSTPFPVGGSDEVVEAEELIPAPESAEIWRAAGRFIIDHPRD